MAASVAPSAISLKLLIDTNAHKVHFAEANKDFVDFLFHILSLPVGAVFRLLKKNPKVGLGNLYGSIQTLSDTYMEPYQSTYSIWHPKLADYWPHVSLLLTDVNDNDDDDEDDDYDYEEEDDDEEDDDDYNDDDNDDDEDEDDDVSIARKLYRCGSYHAYATEDPTALCPECKGRMNNEIHYVYDDGAGEKTRDNGGFVKDGVTYMVMDDLEVKPMPIISSSTLLKEFNVKEIGCLVEKVVSLETNEGLRLLKASLESRNVLTTVFLA